MCHIDSSVKFHQKESTPNIQVAALAELLQNDEIELICRQLGHTWRNPIRPGRVEPRRVKRNDGHYPYLSIPRDLARKKCLSK